MNSTRDADLCFRGNVLKIRGFKKAAKLQISKEFELTDQRYYDMHVARIPGWLEEYTAFRTMDILSWQQQFTTGPLLEIGVFAGRYFSLLMRSASATGDIALGIDTFQYCNLSDVVGHHLKPLGNIEGIAVFHTGPSTELNGDEVIAMMGGKKPRFISVDGSHELQDVYSDLRLAEEILSAKGIVAVDDYLNPLTLGVNQAVNLFFAQPRNVAPFAYIRNKLFLARLLHAEGSRAFLEDRIGSLSDDLSKQWVKNGIANRNQIETTLFGHKTLIFG